MKTPRTHLLNNHSAPSKSGRNGTHLEDPELYLNRELCWLAFNERVLGEAQCESNPLMERLKFAMIFHTNLDEFFMVRLSGLLKLLDKEDTLTSDNRLSYPDDPDPEETLDEVHVKVRDLIRKADQTLQMQILPALSEEGLQVMKLEDLSRTELDRLDEHFEQQVFPVLTPLAVDPAHPFPYLNNLSLYMAVDFQERGDDGEPLLAFIEIPPKLQRFVPVSQRGKRVRFVLLEDIIKRNLSSLFPWTRMNSAHCFRVTRNLDYQLFEGEVKDLMKSIEYELKDRAQKIVVRLECENTLPDNIRSRLRSALQLDSTDCYTLEGLMNCRDLSALLKVDMPHWTRDTPFTPRTPAFLSSQNRDIFDAVRERDLLLHHPFDSFSTVLEFLRQAAEDPNVLAIKQTLYRTGGDSPIIEALLKAAENGKQVTCVVELKARFDEANNIVWAKKLEQAGAHVVFGFVGLKTHSKCTLVVRREGSKLNRYVHLSTGNYNSSTAKVYTDFGMLTADSAATNDIVKLFNLLTGFNIIGHDEPGAESTTPKPDFEKIVVAPFSMRDTFLQLVEQERKNHCAENPGHIILKMNALVDPKLVQALYKASQKGVKVDLIVRGMCTLRPGVAGISENIRVVSIVGRFLEHSRAYWFRNGGDPILYMGSADFMPRNMDRRIEVAWPVERKELKLRVTSLLEMYLMDNTKSHLMKSDGSYTHNTSGQKVAFAVQETLLHLAKKEKEAEVFLSEWKKKSDKSIEEKKPEKVTLLESEIGKKTTARKPQKISPENAEKAQAN